MNTDALLLEILCRSGFEPPAYNRKYYCTCLMHLMMRIDHAPPLTLCIANDVSPLIKTCPTDAREMNRDHREQAKWQGTFDRQLLMQKNFCDSSDRMYLRLPGQCPRIFFQKPRSEL